MRIARCKAYPELMERCSDAMSAVLPNKVGRVIHPGHTEIYCDSKHWPCLFPQHGPGRKHERPIALLSWQQELVDIDPRPLIEGLIHSDGCRVLNYVNGTAYPRYHFANASTDIHRILTNALTTLGIHWTMNTPRDVSVARRESVDILDSFVNPKK